MTTGLRRSSINAARGRGAASLLLALVLWVAFPVAFVLGLIH